MKIDDDEPEPKRLADEDEQLAYENFKIAISTYLTAMDIPPTDALSFLANLIGEYCGVWNCSTEQHEKIMGLSRERFRAISDHVLSQVTKN